MDFVADEGVDRHIVERLRHEGHNVAYVAEMDPGIEDEAVLEQAAAAGAVLVTADKDFGELVFRLGQASSGVLLVRLVGRSPEGKANIVAAVVEKYGDELTEAFSVLSASGVRIRHQQ